MQWEKILRGVVLGGIFLIPFVVLFFSKSLFFPYITSKAFLFRTIVEIILAAWLILILINRKYFPGRSIILWSVGIFVAVITLATIIGVNPYYSFWTNAERMEGLITYLHLFAFLLVAVSVLREEKTWLWLMKTHVIAGFLVAVYGVLQLSGSLPITQGGVRLDSTLGNAAYLGTYMFFIFFIALYLFFKYRDSEFYEDKFYLATALLSFFILYKTATRGAILGIIAGLLVMAFMLAIKKTTDRNLQKYAIGVLVSIILLGTGFYLAKDSSIIADNPVLGRLASISLTEKTTRSRLMVWQIAIQGFKDRPILGWGPGNFGQVYDKYYNPEMHDQEPWFDRTHNVVLGWLVAGGILGLLAYLSIWLALLAGILLIKNDLSWTEKSILVGLLAGYFFQNIFIFDNLTSFIMFFSILGFVSFKAWPKTEELRKNKSINFQPTTSFYVLSPIVVLVLIGSLYYLNLKPIMASTQLIQALTPEIVKINDMAVNKITLNNKEKIEKVLELNTFLNNEAREQLLTLTSKVINQEYMAEEEVKIALANLAQIQANYHLAHNQQSVRAHIFVAGLKRNLGQLEEAIGIYNRALELSPQKQLVMLELANTYFMADQRNDAWTLYEQLYASWPNYYDATKSYGLALLIDGKVKEAEAVLIPIFGTIAIDENAYINFFVEQKDYDRLTEIYQRWVQNEPHNLDVHLSLAGSLYATGKNDEAILVLEEFIENNPESSDEVQQYIEGIKTGQATIN